MAIKTHRQPGQMPQLLFLDKAQFLHVDSLHHLFAVGDRGLFKCLTAAQFFYDAGFFKFAFEFFESFLDVVAFFNLYDNHFCGFIFLMF